MTLSGLLTCKIQSRPTLSGGCDGEMVSDVASHIRPTLGSTLDAPCPPDQPTEMDNELVTSNVALNTPESQEIAQPTITLGSNFLKGLECRHDPSFRKPPRSSDLSSFGGRGPGRRGASGSDLYPEGSNNRSPSPTEVTQHIQLPHRHTLGLGSAGDESKSGPIVKTLELCPIVDRKCVENEGDSDGRGVLVDWK